MCIEGVFMERFKNFINNVFGSVGIIYVIDTGEMIPYSSTNVRKKIVDDFPCSYMYYCFPTTRVLNDNIAFVLILILILCIFLCFVF